MKRSMVDCLAIASLAFLLAFSSGARAQATGPRLALVVGNADYRSGPLATAANDAGLVAETLRAEGFEVVGAANLDQESLRRAFRDFLAKAAQAGPDAIAFVYLSGRGLQYGGENYFAPVEAVIARDADIPIEALRVSDFTRALAALPLRARIVVLDAARANGFAKSGQPLAGGLALVDAEPGSLYAFNAAPGTIAPEEPGPYGAYATALAEMLREGGVPLDEAFSRVRLRVDQVTRGAFMPWDVAKIEPPVVLLATDPKAPAPVAAQSYAALQARPIREFPVEEAYAAAIERDTIAGYQEFLAAYPDSGLARRVRALLAARREALTWRRAVGANTPDAYWTYIRRYPRGPHIWDARRRLEILSAALEPPPRFEAYDFGGLPPPPPVEYEIIDRPVLIFDAADYPPPPPPPVYFLPPRPVVFIELAPPPPPRQGFLPIPIPIPLPYGRPGAPQGVVIQQNFGQQGPVGGAGQAPGQAPLPGRPNTPPVTPGAQAPLPGAVQPNHALPQGHELPPSGGAIPHQPQAPVTQPPIAAPQGLKPSAAPSAPAPTPGAVPHQPQAPVTQPPIAAPQGLKPSAAPSAPAPIPGAAQPNHALPPGHEPPPAGGAIPHQPQAPVAQPPIAAPQGPKPSAAPGAPAPIPGAPQPAHAPPQPSAPKPSAPPSAGAPVPKVEPKAAPSHASPAGEHLTSPPHAAAPVEAPVGKPAAPPVAKPRAPEPEAVHPSAPAAQPKAPAPDIHAPPPQVRAPQPPPPHPQAPPPAHGQPTQPKKPAGAEPAEERR